MSRLVLVLPANFLLSCAAASARSDGLTESGASPAGEGSGWLDTLQAGIAADARAIVSERGGFVAGLPGHPARARFTRGGLTLGEPRAQIPLQFRFSAWGEAGGERAVELVDPVLGDCVGYTFPDGTCSRQLEYAYEGLTAWWLGLDRGVQFGWTVAAPPVEAADRLSFWMRIDGALVLEPLGDGIELVDTEGETWRISGAMAWDALGTPLPAEVSLVGNHVVVQVEAEKAAYPLVVDPVVEAASVVLTGDGSREHFGYGLSTAGDVNGDGFDDVVVGAHWAETESSGPLGAVYLFHGSAGGLSTSPSMRLSGEDRGSYFGVDVTGAGDVNGDGFDDVIIGAPYQGDREPVAEGAVLVYLGSPSGISPTADRVLLGTTAGEKYGLSLAPAGDLNGDGYADVVVGASYHNEEAAERIGAVYVHYGSATGLSETERDQLLGESAFDTFGASVWGAGDVNGDGFDDLVIGATGWDAGPVNNVGAVYVYHGSSGGISPDPVVRMTGLFEGDYLGTSVSGGGDLNGDGYDDVVLGAYLMDDGSAEEAGALFVHLGSSGGISGEPDLALRGEHEGDWFGDGIAVVGDVDRDGFDDVVVGARHVEERDLERIGAAYVYLGSASGLVSDPSLRLTGVAAGDIFGGAVAGAGDVNGDGYQDTLIGASRADDGAGRVYVHTGYADADGDGVRVGGDAHTPQDCDDSDAAIGTAIDQFVDADGDGFGSATVVTACPGEMGSADNALDCNDGSAEVHPEAGDVPGDGVDQDCDGADEAVEQENHEVGGDPGKGSAPGCSSAMPYANQSVANSSRGWPMMLAAVATLLLGSRRRSRCQR